MKNEELEQIANLFPSDNQAILFALYRKEIRNLNFNDLKKAGFRDESIIKRRPDPSEHILFAQTKFHKYTVYEGYNLLYTDYNRSFSIEKNQLTGIEVEKANEIRNKEAEIENLDQLFGAYTQDFETRDVHLATETKKDLEKAKTDLVQLKENFMKE